MVPTIASIGSVRTQDNRNDGTTLAYPAGVQAGDLLLAIWATTLSGGHAPDGWEYAPGSPLFNGQNNDTFGSTISVLWKRADGTESGSVAGWGSSGGISVGRMVAVRGVPTTGSPFDGQSGAIGIASTADIPGAETTSPDCLILYALSFDGATAPGPTAWTNANLTNITNRFNNTTTAGDDTRLNVVTGEFAGPGDYGVMTVTSSPGQGYAYTALAIRSTAASQAHELSGTAVGTGGAEGTLGVARALAGSLAGSSGAGAELRVARAMTALAAGASEVSGALRLKNSLAGAANGDSDALAVLRRAMALAGLSGGEASTAASLSVRMVVRLAGVSSGVSDALAVLRRTKMLAGVANGVATGSGRIKRVRTGTIEPILVEGGLVFVTSPSTVKGGEGAFVEGSVTRTGEVNVTG